MTKNGVINSDLRRVMGRMGHGDRLVVTDRGFPFPLHDRTATIDLSVTEGIPRFLDVVEAVAKDFEFEEVIIAKETEKISPAVHEKLLQIVGAYNNKGNDIKITYIDHPDFKDTVLHGAERGEPVACFVKTGEFTPFANIMFVSGVPF